MSKLSFKLAFKSHQWQNLDLPVEIRKPNLAMVATTLATKTIEVQPGTYFVSATMPAGQALYARVIVGDTEAIATLEPEQVSPRDSRGQGPSLEATLLIRPMMFASDSTPAKRSGGGLEVTAGLLRGPDPRTAVRVPMAAVDVEKIGVGVQLRIRGSVPGTLQQLEFLRPRKPSLQVALPISSGQAGLVVVRRTETPNADLDVDVHLANGEPDLLLSGLSSGYLGGAFEVLNSDRVSAEQLLSEKQSDPFGAAVGAYALLQFGELDRLHDWTENLMNWFPWLPDGLPIRGEHLARIGQHREAMQVFSQIPMRGIPQFSIGISYALARLRLYSRAVGKDLPADLLDQATKALGYLEQVSRWVDFRRPVLSLQGARSDAEYPAGVDIGGYL